MMEPASYKIEGLITLIRSHYVTPQTQAALEARLMQPMVIVPLFFSPQQFKTLTAACERIIPQQRGIKTVDLPGLLDAQLDKGSGKGWRYDALPSVEETFLQGIDGLSQAAQTSHNKAFHDLNPTQQDEILAAVQVGKAAGAIWKTLPATRFFEELLAALAELYYSHPIAKAAIGDLSFADAQGWEIIGLIGLGSSLPQEQKIIRPIPIRI